MITRDFSSSAVVHTSGRFRVVHPYILLHDCKQPIPEMKIVWLERFVDTTGHREFRLSAAMCYGKPLAGQDITTWMDLEDMEHSETTVIKNSRMVGLYELLKSKSLPPGDAGAAYLIRVLIDRFELFGVWADSRGAAKRFIRVHCDHYNTDEEFAKHDMAHRARDFEKL